MKKSTIMALALISVFAFSSNVSAKKQKTVQIDMQNLSCGELLAMDEESMGVMLMWIDGYLSGVTGDTRFNETQFGNFASALGEYCAKNKNSKVLDASNQLGVNH